MLKSGGKTKQKYIIFLERIICLSIPFFWPAMLFAHGDFSLPFMICGYQYLLYEGRKFSKSKKRGVFCDKLLKNPEIDIEELRFYLTFLIPEKEDTSFSWEEFKEKEIKKWKVEFSQLLKFEEIERIIKGEHI